MTDPTPPVPGRSGRSLLAILAGALAVRVLAAVAVEMLARRRGELCLFDDADIYWHLAGSILAGEPYVVWQYDQPHFCLRTPGYPLFLAACRALFGPSTLAVRLVQAALGTLGVAVLAGLVRRLEPLASQAAASGRRRWPLGLERASHRAALIGAIEPYSAASSVLLLSEAVFVPAMLWMLWGLAALASRSRTSGRWAPQAVATGLMAGLGVLSRPSWALFVPLSLLGFVLLTARERRPLALRQMAVVALALGLTMAPWWVRNAQVTGRFVPTALWMGASLYDGLRPNADGSSDMRFLDDPVIRSWDEPTQDARLRQAAVAWAVAHPRRVLELAALKLARFWSPWPNADQFHSRPGAIASALVTLPLYALIAAGAARCVRRRAWLTLALLAGPVLYFGGLHLLFVSSIRYRIPALVPAFGLAALAWPRSEPADATPPTLA